MELLKQWALLARPDHVFQPQEAWQALVALVLIGLLDRFVKRSGAEAEQAVAFGPRRWIGHNRVFVIFWAVNAALALLGSLVPGGLNVFKFIAVLGLLWIVIGIASSFLRQHFWSESVAAVFYALTGLRALALEGRIVEALEGLDLTIGAYRFTAYGIGAGLIAFIFALWLSLALARLFENRVQRIEGLKPSLRVLISKVFRFVLILIAVIISISSMGVDLTALTFFGGAIGLGLGFGFQKVISNLVCGVVLLTDNSIKPGDVIQIDETYGWINNLRARYASVITRDGTEHLIPNEDLVTQKVINWSFTNELVRIKTRIGVAYGENPHQVIEIVEQAAVSIQRVLKDPAPLCLLTGFGDSSVDFELRFWLADPSGGVANVRSQVLLKVWDAFKEHGIEIPFPQRDIHIKSGKLES